ncbi:SCO4225 family membrane protein [Streptomyces sp. NPDC059506]|uniref:SCO4225 family membrane protein n=1 Tax=Streptomyces sp. NPDC059506 TaxID=3347751 RepID=UPI00369FEDA8
MNRGNPRTTETPEPRKPPAHADASFAGVLLILATAPTSLVLTLLPWESAPASYLVVAASAVVNATLIGLLVRALGRRGATAARA